MQLNKIVPLFATDKLAATKAFYTTHFGFKVAFETDCFLSMQHTAKDHLELSYMAPSPGDELHPAVPAASPEGIYYVLVVDDVDAEFTRLAAAGLTIDETPEDMPWGDRRMTLTDPVGMRLYVCHPIPVSAEFAGAAK